MYIYHMYLYSTTFSITSNKSVNECHIFRVHFRKVNALAIYNWVSFSFAFARHAWGRRSGRNLWVVSCMLDKVIFFNSLAQGRFWCDFKNSIFNLVLLVSRDLCMIMPWDECHRTLLMISQHWYGVTGPQWVKSLKTLRPEKNGYFADDIFKCIFSSMKWLYFDSYGAVGDEILVKVTFPL